MKLKAVEMQGFKSFPDRTKLTFDDGITVIVGPNGSGKSNISDAIKWVFGEQSVKSLRGAKMEDVIFGGSISRKPTGFAWVSLFIDNTDRSIDIDSDEVVITRRLYRSGESEYRINNNPVRLRDINEMFMDTGLGRDGYSVIEQLNDLFTNLRRVAADNCRAARLKEVVVFVAVYIIKLVARCLCKDKRERIVECEVMLNAAGYSLLGNVNHFL